MRPGRLYIKIFFSFLFVLIITEVLIFGLFVFTAERSFRHRIDRHLGIYTLVAREMVEGAIESKQGTAHADNEPLKEIIVRLAQACEAKVWLAASDGTPVLKSFEAEIPPSLLRIEAGQSRDAKGLSFFGDFRRAHGYRAVIPVEIGKGETGSLHILFERREKEHPGGPFALGLLAIGGVIALLIIPVSRLVTKRVTQLRMSALRIAEGDLLHRAPVKGKDEIGELGRTFNLMTDKLERMIQVNKELTAHISHELRSPLARIRIAEELLREKWLKRETAHCEDHFNDIREDVEEMDHLIGRILELSKLDLHESPLKPEVFSPSELMDGLLDKFRPILKQKGLRLTRDVSYDSPFFGDREALRTALSNVLDNAAKFSPERGHLNVNMHSEGPFLFISITNTFPALAQEDLLRIFEPFSRIESSPGKGHGLGLAITKKIVEKHGGQIEALNSVEGLEIRMRLPIRQGIQP